MTRAPSPTPDQVPGRLSPRKPEGRRAYALDRRGRGEETAARAVRLLAATPWIARQCGMSATHESGRRHCARYGVDLRWTLRHVDKQGRNPLEAGHDPRHRHRLSGRLVRRRGRHGGRSPAGHARSCAACGADRRLAGKFLHRHRNRARPRAHRSPLRAAAAPTTSASTTTRHAARCSRTSPASRGTRIST